MKKGNEMKKEIEFLKLFLAIVPFLIGLFYEWTSSVASIILLGFLLYCQRKNGKIKIFSSLLLAATILIAAMYGISALWAVDTGMALLGFSKFLPLPLFVLSVGQIDREERKDLLSYVPIAGGVMTVVSGVLGMIPAVSSYFMVNGRLAGFFQYPNTFALFLLIGFIILCAENHWNVQNILNTVILLIGIMFTGSRTTFVLLVGVIVCCSIHVKEKRVRIGMLGGLAAMVVIVGIYVVLTGNVSAIGRFFTISVSSSTFLGRLLYFKDALPIVLKSPFGLGYLGYYFTQGSFQTGVYSVMNIHNELLQILLDIGWVPLVVLGGALVRGFLKGGFKERVIIGVIALHCMMDFDLQFISIFFILLAVVDLEEKKAKSVNKKICTASAVVLGCLSLYFGITSALYSMEMHREAVTVYPGNTLAWMQLLTEAEEVEEMEEIADKILSLNPSNALANNAKAKAAYSNGDFGNMILYKQKAIEYSKYTLDEYLDYCDMLYDGYRLYRKHGDQESSDICAQHIVEIPEDIENVLEETDALAYKIDDVPELELPERYVRIVERVQRR